MKNKTEEAWNLFDQGQYLNARVLWEEIIEAHPSDEDLSAFCYTLCALKEFDRARNIYNELWTKTKQDRYLHQLAMVEREAGNYKMALDYALEEATLIKEDDSLGRSANLYEQGKINQLLGNVDKALELANKCDEMAQGCDDLIMKGCAKRLLGDLFKLKNNDQKLQTYLKSSSYFSKAEDYIGRDEVLNELGEIMVESPKIEDADDLYQIEFDNYGEEEATELETFKEILLYLKDSNFYQMKKISIKEKVVGFYCLVFENESAPELVDIAVSKKYQSMGIGSILMSFALQNILDSAKRVGLTVRAGNSSAIKLYENFGFIQVEKINDYYEDGETAFKMKLVLS